MWKNRFSKELKIQIVSEYFNSNCSVNFLSKKYNIDESQLRELINLYKHHGIYGVIKRCKHYDYNFKIEIIEYMLKNKLSIRETASIFGIRSHSTLSKWKEKYIKGGKESLLRKSQKSEIKTVKHNRDKKEKDSNVVNSSSAYRQLQKELEYLKAENAYLKKLNALVQQREKLQQERK